MSSIFLLIIKPRKVVMFRQIKNMDGKSKNNWYPTDYGYSWGGHWLMAGEGKKQVLFGYLHTGTGGLNG